LVERVLEYDGAYGQRIVPPVAIVLQRLSREDPANNMRVVQWPFSFESQPSLVSDASYWLSLVSDASSTT